MTDLAKRIAALPPEMQDLLLKQLMQEESEESTIDTIPVVSREINSFPLSFSQQRMWLLDQMEPGTPAYNLSGAIRLTGNLNIPALEQTFSEIVRRHETLRTTFATVDEQPVQVIHPPTPFLLSSVDLTTLPKETREAEVRKLVVGDALYHFDLEKGPLMRATLYKLDEADYVLAIVSHHIVADGWSTSVIVKELQALYSVFTQGLPSSLPELPVQYADFAHWQRASLESGKFDRQLTFWKEQLSGELPTLPLPLDHPHPNMRTYHGATFSLSLSNALIEKLSAMSKRYGSTLFMALLSAFNALLYRYSGQEDLIVGSAIANRNRLEVEGLIGCFINMLALRTDLSGNPSFRELLSRVQKVTMAAYEHQDLPIEKLMEHIHAVRVQDQNPIFQVAFIYQNYPSAEVALGDLKISRWDIEHHVAALDLLLEIREENGELVACMKYNNDVFDQATIQRMLVHYQILLESIVTDPEQPVAVLPMFTPVEEQQLLADWNNVTLTDSRADLCIHQLFEAHAAGAPNATAVVAPGLDPASPRQSLTYQELNHRANQLAHFLIQQGVGPESVVGICVNRSPEMIVGVLGVLKAGGAYLPLDPFYPTERIRFSLKDSGAVILLTEQALATPFHGDGYKVLCLDQDWEVIAEESIANPSCATTPRNLVYITYTSGSTGQSKGVMIEHHSLVNAYLAWEQAYQLKSLTSHLQMANFPFDVFTGDLVRALCSGGQLVICPREILLAPQQLLDLIRQEKIDCAEFVPAVLRPLIKYLQETGQILESVRVLACGSDSWYVSEYRNFQATLGTSTRLINSFGLTEATIDSTYFEGSVSEMPPDGFVPIGRPFANTKLYILNSQMQPAPIGVDGELYIGGPGVARGYVNHADLTAQKFVPNPFENAPDVRLYKTGDKARYLPDGNIEFLGRIDNQVKIRGFRVELGEVESILGQHPDVLESVVIARQDRSGEKRLLAFVVPNPNQPPATHDLRDYLQQRLPDYMIPTLFTFLDALPLNASGKIDRKALPEPDLNALSRDNLFVAPQTPLQERLASIWVDVLGLELEKIGITDNFFELGGHSLLATQVVSRIRKEFQINFLLRDFFMAPTIAQLAKAMETLEWAAQSQLASSNLSTGEDEEIRL